MYTDTHFNFFEVTEQLGLEEGALALQKMAAEKPGFAMDCGIKENDIWARAARFRECLDLIEDETQRKTLQNIIHFSAGIMPDADSIENRFDAVTELEETIKNFKSEDEWGNRLVAIGPCGVDHDWDSVEFQGRSHEYFSNDQIDDEINLFALELTLAKKLDMPVILHSRNAFKQTQDVLKAVKHNKGVVHSYSYSKSELDFFLDLGWYISFSGNITYSGKKAIGDMADLISYVPKDQLLIETDSPYYAPVPLKNQVNTPDNIHYIYQFLASKLDTTSRRLSDIVDRNCEKLFGN